MKSGPPPAGTWTSASTALGLGVITPEQGLDWLQALMAGGASHVVVSPIHWDVLFAQRARCLAPAERISQFRSRAHIANRCKASRHSCVGHNGG